MIHAELNKWLTDNLKVISEIGTISEIDDFINMVFKTNVDNEYKFLYFIIDDVFDKLKGSIIYESIIKHILPRDDDGLDNVIEYLFSKKLDIETHSIHSLFNFIKDEKVKIIISKYISK